MCQTFLEMICHGEMDPRADPVATETFKVEMAIPGHYDCQMSDMVLVIAGNEGRRTGVDGVGVSANYGTSPGVPVIHTTKSDSKNGCLDRIEARIADTRDANDSAFGPAVSVTAEELLVQLRTRGDHGSCASECTKILRGVEAERTDVSERPRLCPDWAAPTDCAQSSTTEIPADRQSLMIGTISANCPQR